MAPYCDLPRRITSPHRGKKINPWIPHLSPGPLTQSPRLSYPPRAPHLLSQSPPRPPPFWPQQQPQAPRCFRRWPVPQYSAADLGVPLNPTQIPTSFILTV